ncbi:MAG: DUF4244 domain-containing protein [Marmoricola sp.]
MTTSTAIRAVTTLPATTGPTAPTGPAARRDERGATTAEYAVCTGAGVGFAGVLFKFLTSDLGQGFLKLVWAGIKSLLPF